MDSTRRAADDVCIKEFPGDSAVRVHFFLGRLTVKAAAEEHAEANPQPTPKPTLKRLCKPKARGNAKATSQANVST